MAPWSNYWGARGVQLNILILLLASNDFLLFGYDQGVMGSLLINDNFLSHFPMLDTGNTDIPVSEQNHNAIIQGAAIGSYTLGCFLGACVIVKLGDYLGRRKVIFLGSAFMIVGAAIQASSFVLGQLIVGRIISGIGNGFDTSTVPMWQSECSRAHLRGKLVMVEGALITGGICLSYWIDFGFWFTSGEMQWRFPIAFQLIFAVIQFCFVLSLPESPRWLVKKGRMEEAAGVLGAILDLPTDSEEVRTELASIRDTLDQQTDSLKYLFKNGRNKHFHRVALGYINQMFQQISGINLITYYAGTIYQQSIGLSELLSRILAACNGTEYFLASWIAFFTIERYGRRPLMLFGAVGMSCTMAILAGTTSPGFQNAGSDTATKAGIAASVFLFVFNTFFAIGWLGMTWLYPAEIVSLQVRAPSNGLSTSANWIFNWLIVFVTPIMFNNIKEYTYMVFAIINAGIVIFTYFFFPETKGRSLEEIDLIFAQSRGWLDAVTVSLKMPKMSQAEIDKTFHQMGIGPKTGSGDVDAYHVEDATSPGGNSNGEKENGGRNMP